MTPATATVKLKGVGQISVTARDLPRAVAFYRDVLGLPLILEIPNAAFLTCGDVRLMLSTEAEHPASVLYYTVEGIEAAHDALVSRGVQFLGEPHLIARMPDHDLWMAFFHDPEGNLLGLMEEVRPPAPRP